MLGNEPAKTKHAYSHLGFLGGDWSRKAVVTTTDRLRFDRRSTAVWVWNKYWCIYTAEWCYSEHLLLKCR